MVHNLILIANLGWLDLKISKWMYVVSVDTMEDGQRLIYTSWVSLEWSSLATFVLEDYLGFIKHTIII